MYRIILAIVFLFALVFSSVGGNVYAGASSTNEDAVDFGNESSITEYIVNGTSNVSDLGIVYQDLNDLNIDDK